MIGRRAAAMSHSTLSLGAVLVAGFATIGQGVAANPAGDPRLREVDYQPMAVLSLTTFLGYHVHLQFAPDEHFINLAAGDSSGIDVGAEANHLMLKPKRPNAGMNVTILTNRRVYYVDYRAVSRTPRPDEIVYSIVFRYPEQDAVADKRKPAQSNDDARVIAARPIRNRDYWYCGGKALKPTAVTDDGLQIRLTFAPHSALPATYAATPDGAETLVNSHVEDDSIVIHSLVKRLILRRGREVACVVDRSSQRDGQRATSGTIDASVERVVGDRRDEARK